MLINNIVFNYTSTSLTGFVVLVYLCLDPPDDELIETAICMRHIRDKNYVLLVVQFSDYVLCTAYVEVFVSVPPGKCSYSTLSYATMSSFHISCNSLLIVIQSSDAILI